MQCIVGYCYKYTCATYEWFCGPQYHKMHVKEMAKIRSYVHNNIAFSSEKVVSSESGEKYARIKHRWEEKTVLNKYVGKFCCERTTVWTFILTAPIHCRGSIDEQEK